MKRREFITPLGSAAAAWPLAARAQQPSKARRIGVFAGLTESDASVQPMVAAFRGALAKLGWTEGSNLLIEYHWGGGDADKMRRQAAQLATLAPDVIFREPQTGKGPGDWATYQLRECSETAEGVARESKGVRSCPRAGCGKSACPVVCPVKAGVFSRR